MWRAVLKGTALWGFGRVPGGAAFYRRLTREWMGTQATHVDKLKRVWPGYVDVWKDRCGLIMEGAEVWVHEGGWTPFASFVTYLLTGRGGILTNSEGRLLDRYLARAVNGALATALPAGLVPDERRRDLEALRWHEGARAAVAAIDGSFFAGVNPSRLALASGSVDLCHSGGALEHYTPKELTAFLSECFRILRPGGIASHVFDHRDHLHHADRRWPFLAHLALPDAAYAAFLGHPLLYHNRLLPDQVVPLFASAGFAPIAVRRMILPDRRYVEGDDALAGRPGIPRALLAPRFRHASDPDLRTAACHYLFRKPLG